MNPSAVTWIRSNVPILSNIRHDDARYMYQSEHKSNFRSPPEYEPRAPRPPDTDFMHSDPSYWALWNESVHQQEFGPKKVERELVEHEITRTHIQPDDKRPNDFKTIHMKAFIYNPPMKPVAFDRSKPSDNTQIYWYDDRYTAPPQTENKASYRDHELTRKATISKWLLKSKCPYPVNNQWLKTGGSETKEEFRELHPSKKLFIGVKKLNDTEILGKSSLYSQYPLSTHQEHFNMYSNLECPRSFAVGSTYADNITLGDDRLTVFNRCISKTHQDYIPFSFEKPMPVPKNRYEQMVLYENKGMLESITTYKDSFKPFTRKEMFKEISENKTWKSSIHLGKGDEKEFPLSNYKTTFSHKVPEKFYAASKILPPRIQIFYQFPTVTDSLMHESFVPNKAKKNKINENALQELKNSHIAMFQNNVPCDYISTYKKQFSPNETANL